MKYDDKYFSLIQFDLITTTQALVDAIYEGIENSKIFSKESIIITATHTHNDPEIKKAKPRCDAEYEKKLLIRLWTHLTSLSVSFEKKDTTAAVVPHKIKEHKKNEFSKISK